MTQQVLLIHGGTTYKTEAAYKAALVEKELHLEWMLSRRDWKNELQDDLGPEFEVYTPQMPNKQNAQYNEWVIVFDKLLNALDDNVVLIGHSLGGAFLAKYLSEHKIVRTIRQTCLLGTPFDNRGMEKEPLASFLRATEDLSLLKRQAGQVYMYHSEDDFAVPFNHVEKFVEHLPDARLRRFKKRNHFLQPHIPELVADIHKECLKYPK